MRRAAAQRRWANTIFFHSFHRIHIRMHASIFAFYCCTTFLPSTVAGGLLESLLPLQMALSQETAVHCTA